MQIDPDSLYREEYEQIIYSLLTRIEHSALYEWFQSDKNVGALIERLQSYIGHNK